MSDPTEPSAPGAAETRIREELEKAASLISGARRLMAEGRTVDLTALEGHTRAVAEAIRAAPTDVAASYREHLSALMDNLDALESDLTHQHANLESGLDAIRRREAQSAYATQPPPAPGDADTHGDDDEKT